MTRRIAHFSCGAASAVATKLSTVDEIWYASTGAEDADNARFMTDCERWFGQPVRVIRSKEYSSTWEVWERKRYLSGVAGAPCTGELKVGPRLAEQRPDDIHIFGYTADSNDIRRAKIMRENWPDLNVEFPLIERGLNKAACLAMLLNAGIAPPRVYAMGYPNANCIPCVKAQSPAYWALVRKHHPCEFKRMAKLSLRLGAKLARIRGQRVFLHEIPRDQPTTEPLAPACDMLCGLAEQELQEVGRGA